MFGCQKNVSFACKELKPVTETPPHMMALLTSLLLNEQLCLMGTGNQIKSNTLSQILFFYTPLFDSFNH